MNGSSHRFYVVILFNVKGGKAGILGWTFEKIESCLTSILCLDRLIGDNLIFKLLIRKNRNVSNFFVKSTLLFVNLISRGGGVLPAIAYGVLFNLQRVGWRSLLCT